MSKNEESKLLKGRGELLTEQSNYKSKNLDLQSTMELVSLFSEEDLEPQKAVSRAIPVISKAIELITKRLKHGGRLFYIGSGTSGRLGVLDASECPPTFCTSPDLVQAIIAGGNKALRNSSESSEDNTLLSIKDLKCKDYSSNDCLIGITAGGTTPYVHSALLYSLNINALTISISCVPKKEVDIPCDIDIRLLTGPELLTGSTRLKAGTATKMALNIISTIVMIKMGKVYGNKMVDMSVTNSKLKDRALRIIIDVTKVDKEKAKSLLDESNGSVKVSILMALASLSAKQAKEILEENDQYLRLALKACKIE